MPAAFKRALVGYSPSQAQAVLARLDAARAENERARETYLEAVREALHSTRLRVDALERAVAHEREEERALLAVIEVLASQGAERIRSLKAQLAEIEQEKVAAVAHQEALLGERRAKLREIRLSVLQMAALVEDDVEWPEPQMPKAAGGAPSRPEQTDQGSSRQGAPQGMP